jgi:Flp pilus assembly protein TadG
MALADVTTAIRRHIDRYFRSDRGNLTMMAGLSAIPVIAAAGMAIDYSRISRVHDKMQLIADGAALAAVSAKNISGTTDQKKAARIAIATNYLNSGLATLTDVSVVGTPTVTAVGSSVSITATAKVKGSFMNVLNAIDSSADLGGGSGGSQAGSGTGKIYGITVKSKASSKSGMSYLCILALNNSDSQSLQIQGTADLYAPNCAVWVNSSSNSGLYENGNATLTSNNICVYGSYAGTNYFPYKPKTGPTDCPRFTDPLKTTFLNDYNATYPKATVRYNGYNSSSKKYTQMTFSGSGETTIQPGIYDGGIQVKAGATLKLAGGTYFIQNGKFEVQQGTVVNADSNGVTIVLTEPTAGTKVTNGTQVRLDVTAQSQFTLKAPSSGRFAGIVIAQHPNSITGTSKTTANSIIGGGTKSLTGIVYYPSNILYITGGGTGTVTTPEKVAADDPLFAIVADKVYIEGNGQLRVGGASDNEAAGLPALPAAGSGTTTISLN